MDGVGDFRFSASCWNLAEPGSAAEMGFFLRNLFPDLPIPNDALSSSLTCSRSSFDLTGADERRCCGTDISVFRISALDTGLAEEAEVEISSKCDWQNLWMWHACKVMAKITHSHTHTRSGYSAVWLLAKKKQMYCSWRNKFLLIHCSDCFFIPITKS